MTPRSTPRGKGWWINVTLWFLAQIPGWHNCKTRRWQLKMFTPKIEEDFQFDYFFSRRLKPPTRKKWKIMIWSYQLHQTHRVSLVSGSWWSTRLSIKSRSPEWFFCSTLFFGYGHMDSSWPSNLKWLEECQKSCTFQDSWPVKIHKSTDVMIFFNSLAACMWNLAIFRHYI